MAARSIGGPAASWRSSCRQAPERLRLPDLPGGDGDAAGGNRNDPTDNSWQELLALLATVEPAELIDPSVGAERLLYRLFHEHGVRVFEGVKVADECSCSRDKIRGILGGFSAEEIEDSTEDGRDQGQLRVLLESLRVRPGGVRSRSSEALGVASQFTVRDLPGMSSEKAGMSISNISPRALRIV